MKAKKMFLKSMAILMVFCVIVQSGVSAANLENMPYKEITVLGDVDSQKAQQIVGKISGETTISPFGIACLFGHSTARTTVYETTHRYYSTAPKCRRVTYDVTYCTRSSCDYIVYTQIGVNAVHCCS